MERKNRRKIAFLCFAFIALKLCLRRNDNFFYYFEVESERAKGIESFFARLGPLLNESVREGRECVGDL